MENAEIGRVGASNFRDPQSYGQAHLMRPIDADEEPVRGEDSVELTEPHKAALRLLRERVLENTRLALELPRRSNRPIFARIPMDQISEDRPRRFLSRLISDQNLLASTRRGTWPTEKLEEALETGLVQGTAETAEILYELDELDIVVWRLIGSVVDEFYRKLRGVSPEEMRERLRGAP